jgi:hypothetical protein
MRTGSPFVENRLVAVTASDCLVRIRAGVDPRIVGVVIDRVSTKFDQWLAIARVGAADEKT